MIATHQTLGASFDRFDARHKVNAALRRLNWKPKHLAARAGLAQGTVRNIVCGTNATAAGRAKVEKALGEKIWTTEDADPLTTNTTNEDQTPPTS
ncbi:MAG: helix-turn-helix transcriptional regulator [Chthoniobacter sp.]|uniref:helix-turn-helix domain-containing protein n=1 Tax=Chthoniobacter sp. TaxID=2510640 RepID=UPI0032A4B438